MKLATRKSTPLQPIAERARALSGKCAEFWVATAFVSDAAVDDVVGTALDAGAAVRFLTGTFGNVTRLRTFRKLHRLARVPQMDARVWEGDFHAKLYL